jgi:hypothetical protein
MSACASQTKLESGNSFSRKGEGLGFDVIVLHPRVPEPHGGSGVKTDSIRPVELADSSGPVAPQCLVSHQGFWNVGGGGAAQQRGQRHRIFDGLIGALAHVRQHRMGRIAKQGEPTGCPACQRLAVIETPRECGVDLRKQVTNARIPVGELCGRSTVSAADQANPGSDAQRSPGHCDFGCNLHSDSAAFTWTGQLSGRAVVKMRMLPVAAVVFAGSRIVWA